MHSKTNAEEGGITQRFTSGGGGAMAALGRKGPTTDLEGLKRRRQWWVMERTKGGLKADPGGAPVSTVPLPELASESAAISGAEIEPTKVLGRRRSRWCPCMARGGGSRRRCRPWKSGRAWGIREGRSSPPKLMPGVEGSRFALRWSGADGNGASEGEGNGPIQTDTRYRMVAFSTWSVRRRWKGPMLG